MATEKVMGMIVEDAVCDDARKVRIKFLGLPGECGPELILPRSLVAELKSMLTDYLQTGVRQAR